MTKTIDQIEEEIAVEAATFFAPARIADLVMPSENWIVLSAQAEAASAMLAALQAAVLRVQLANTEGNPILSAWLPDAHAAIAAAEAAGITTEG